MIDIHNHLLVDTDDGPKTMLDAVDLLKQAINQGITDVIVTPHHCDGQYFTPKKTLLSKMDALNSVIDSEELNIKIYPGHEVRMHPDLIEDLKSGETLTLNHSRYILIELSDADLPKHLENLMFDLQMEGYVPVIGHPERYTSLIEKEDMLYRLVKKGVLCQATAGAVCGAEGRVIKNTVMDMIEDHLIHFVASDAHDREARPFMLYEAYREIEQALGMPYVKQLKENAVLLLNDEEILTKAPVIEVNTDKSRTKGFLRYFKGK